MCSQWVLIDKIEEQQRNYNTNNRNLSKSMEKIFILIIIYLLGDLYSDQGKLAEVEKIY